MENDSTKDGKSSTAQRLISDTASEDDQIDTKANAKSSSAASSPTNARAGNHKRNASGGLLSRFLFTRSIEQDSDGQDGQEEASSPLDEQAPSAEYGSVANTAPASAEHTSGEAGKAQSVKTRKRKGSLRKVALLGGRAFSGGEGRERRGSFLRSPVKTSSSQSKPTSSEVEHTREEQSRKRESNDLDTRLSQASYSAVSASDDDATNAQSSLLTDTPAVTTARLSLLTAQTAGPPSTNGYNGIKQNSDQSGATLSSPSDPKSPTSYASTTEDDDDGLSFSRPSTSAISVVSSEATYPPPLPPSDVASYFPALPRALRPRSQNRVRPSPLQNALMPTPEIYSYAETEYWGWVILFVTWLLFTVGMGSCLDIWSWAWDVGETPYAPPELEDDPTLPIVGYYPALIVLTGVVAWVWITVAWIGMKYFRHAKIEV